MNGHTCWTDDTRCLNCDNQTSVGTVVAYEIRSKIGYVFWEYNDPDNGDYYSVDFPQMLRDTADLTERGYRVVLEPWGAHNEENHNR